MLNGYILDAGCWISNLQRGTLGSSVKSQTHVVPLLFYSLWNENKKFKKGSIIKKGKSLRWEIQIRRVNKLGGIIILKKNERRGRGGRDKKGTNLQIAPKA